MNSMPQDTTKTLGFIGCGTIACAIATGLLTQTDHPISKVYVSRRSESKSSELVSKFPDKVVVCDDNQDIVDKCDILFLCVLPQYQEEVLKSLNIGKEKTLVSVVVSLRVLKNYFRFLHNSSHYRHAIRHTITVYQ